jgi:hypothetical protein
MEQRRLQRLQVSAPRQNHILTGGLPTSRRQQRRSQTVHTLAGSGRQTNMSRLRRCAVGSQ